MTSTPQVQTVLALDALTCLAAGLLMTAGATILALLTGLPPELLRYAGIALFPVALLFGWLSRTRSVPLPLLWLAIAGNLAWIVGNVVVVELLEPTVVGTLFVLAQAIVVLLLTIAEWRGVDDVRGAAA